MPIIAVRKHCAGLEGREMRKERRKILARNSTVWAQIAVWAFIPKNQLLQRENNTAQHIPEEALLLHVCLVSNPAGWNAENRVTKALNTALVSCSDMRLQGDHKAARDAVGTALQHCTTALPWHRAADPSLVLWQCSWADITTAIRTSCS